MDLNGSLSSFSVENAVAICMQALPVRIDQDESARYSGRAISGHWIDGIRRKSDHSASRCAVAVDGHSP